MPVNLAIRVVPGSSRDSIVGWYGDSLKIKVAAPPEKGKANRSVLALLAGKLDVPVSSLTLASGQTSNSKVVRIEGLDETSLKERLGQAETGQN